MSSPHSLHHSLLRPCVIHILRAAGYHSTRPSVIDAFTDISGHYMFLLAATAAKYSNSNHPELELNIEDVRMAMQECGALAPEKVLEEQMYDGEEDTRGVDAFLNWAIGLENKEIRRVALEGGEGEKEDYLTVLKKKHSQTIDETRYHGTLLGTPTDSRVIQVEGGDITSLKEWADKLRERQRSRSSSRDQSRAQSSELSSLGENEMEGIDFEEGS